VDFAVQQRDRALSEALETWHAKAEGKVAIDYGFHMIVLDLPDSRVPELEEMVRQDVTSFKLFMAYLGAVMVDDTTIFKTLSRAANNGVLLFLHAQHGHMIDALIKATLAEGKTAPKIPCHDTLAYHRGRGGLMSGIMDINRLSSGAYPALAGLWLTFERLSRTPCW
jgi:dihydroorotase-like cyclic amidohydrolase